MVDKIFEVEKADLFRSYHTYVPNALMVDEDDLDSSSAPRGFLCPITLQVMRDPVIAADGHTYDRSSIEVGFFDHFI